MCGGERERERIVDFDDESDIKFKFFLSPFLLPYAIDIIFIDLTKHEHDIKALKFSYGHLPSAAYTALSNTQTRLLYNKTTHIYKKLTKTTASISILQFCIKENIIPPSFKITNNLNRLDSEAVTLNQPSDTDINLLFSVDF